MIKEAEQIPAGLTVRQELYMRGLIRLGKGGDEDLVKLGIFNSLKASNHTKKSLVRAGYIETISPRGNDEKGRYTRALYRVTSIGQKALAQLTEIRDRLNYVRTA